MQLRGFNDDATRLIAFIFARDIYVMKKTMGRENGGEWTPCPQRNAMSTGTVAIFSTHFFIATAFSRIERRLHRRHRRHHRCRRRHHRRRRCRCRASAKAKFPISGDTEDPCYK